jgi:hypothetical protein
MTYSYNVLRGKPGVEKSMCEDYRVAEMYVAQDRDQW